MQTPPPSSPLLSPPPLNTPALLFPVEQPHPLLAHGHPMFEDGFVTPPLGSPLRSPPPLDTPALLFSVEQPHQPPGSPMSSQGSADAPSVAPSLGLPTASRSALAAEPRGPLPADPAPNAGRQVRRNLQPLMVPPSAAAPTLGATGAAFSGGLGYGPALRAVTLPAPTALDLGDLGNRAKVGAHRRLLQQENLRRTQSASGLFPASSPTILPVPKITAADIAELRRGLGPAAQVPAPVQGVGLGAVAAGRTTHAELPNGPASEDPEGPTG